ncbi:MAG: helix-turn-helix transcriptional regulator [Haliea sp.]|nr:helix-turn-helix transcriptional regulator [Haliea sp.]
MTTRARGRPLQNAVSDDALLDAALLSFGENGYDGASVREIARRLAVSHNPIPQRFGSRKGSGMPLSTTGSADSAMT